MFKGKSSTRPTGGAATTAAAGVAGAGFVDRSARVATKDWREKYLEGGVRVLDVLTGSPSLLEAVERTKSAVGKRIIMFIGPTGAGKSTAVNYLLGHEFEPVETGAGDELLGIVKRKEGVPVAELGGAVESCTTYPECYSDPFSDLCYCDCPGFYDTGNAQRRIITNMSNDMVAKSSAAIGGIVMLVEEGALYGQKAAGFRELAMTLGRMIRDFDKKTPEEIEYLKSSMTVIYNPKGGKKRNFKQLGVKLDELLASEQPKLDGLSMQIKMPIVSKETHEAYALAYSKVMVMTFMKDLLVTGRFLILNPLDGGVSREQIFACLRGAPGIDKGFLSFSDMDPAQRQMTDVMIKIAGEANLLMVNNNSARDEMTYYTRRIAELGDTLVGLQKQIGTSASQGMGFVETLAASRGETEAGLRVNRTLLAAKEVEARRLNKAVEGLKRQLALVDSDERTLCFEKDHEISTSGRVARGGALFLGGLVGLPFMLFDMVFNDADATAGAANYVATKKIEYDGVPFTEMELTPGLLGDSEVFDKSQGRLVFLIDSVGSKSGQHYVRLYTEKRLMSGNPQKIAVLKQQLGVGKDEGKLKSLARILADIAALQKKIREDETFLGKLSSDADGIKVAMTARKTQLEGRVREIEVERRDIIDRIIPEKREILAANIANFEAGRPIYSLVQQIAVALCFHTDPAGQFDVIRQFMDTMSRDGSVVTAQAGGASSTSFAKLVMVGDEYEDDFSADPTAGAGRG